MNERKLEPESIGQILKNSKNPKRSKTSIFLEVINLNWCNIAGERLSTHTVPSRISRGTLIIKANGSTWATECQLQSHEILEKIRCLIGEGIRKIKVQSKPCDFTKLKRIEEEKDTFPETESHELKQLPMIRSNELRRSLEFLVKNLKSKGRRIR